MAALTKENEEKKMRQEAEAGQGHIVGQGLFPAALRLRKGALEDAGNATYLTVLRFLCPDSIREHWNRIEAGPVTT